MEPAVLSSFVFFKLQMNNPNVRKFLPTHLLPLHLSIQVFMLFFVRSFTKCLFASTSMLTCLRAHATSTDQELAKETLYLFKFYKTRI